MVDILDVWKIRFEADAKKLFASFDEGVKRSKEWYEALKKADMSAQLLWNKRAKIIDKAGAKIRRHRRTILKKLKTAWLEINREVMNYNKINDRGMRQRLKYVEQAGKKAGIGYIEAFGKLQQQGLYKGKLGEDMARALKKMMDPSPFDKFKASIEGIAKPVQTVILGLLGIQAVRSLRAVVDIMKKAAETSIAYQFSLYRLNLAVRASQRVIGASIGTTAEWNQHVQDLRKQFGLFSEKELRNLTAKALMYTRELNFTKEEIKELTRAVTVLATVNEKDLDAAMLSVISGLSGYQRSLRNLSIQVDKNMIEQEALRQGITDEYEALDQATKTHLTYTLIMRQVRAMTEDVGDAQLTLSGQIRTSAANIQDSGAVIGSVFATMVVSAKKVLVTVTAIFARVALSFAMLDAMAARQATRTGEWFKRQGAHIVGFLRELAGDAGAHARMMAEVTEGATERINEAFIAVAKAYQLLDPIAEDVEQDLDLVSAAVDRTSVAMRKLALTITDDLADALDKYEEGLHDASTSGLKDMVEAREDYAKKEVGVLKDLERDLVKDKREAEKKRLEIQADRAEKLVDIDEELYKKQTDEAEEYHKNELRHEEDFQIAMQRLHASYVENLWGALAARDARAILNIQRQYRRRRREAGEDFSLDKTRRAEDHATRLAEFDEWAQEQRDRARDAARERLDDVKASLIELRAARRLAYEERRKDRLDRLNERIADIKEATREQRANLRDSLAKELTRIGKHYADAEDATFLGGLAIYKALETIFGPRGEIDVLMDSFYQRWLTNARRGLALPMPSLVGAPGAPPAHGIGSTPTPYPWWQPPIGYGQQWQQTPSQYQSPLRAPQGTPPYGGQFGPQTVQLDVVITADENFSVDFEQRLYAELVPAIVAIVTRGRGPY